MDFVKQPRKNRRTRKRRKVVTKWVAKDQISTTTDPSTSKAQENVSEPQETNVTLAEEEFPIFASPMRKVGS